MTPSPSDDDGRPNQSGNEEDTEDTARANLEGSGDYPDKDPDEYTYEDYLRAVCGDYPSDETKNSDTSKP